MSKRKPRRAPAVRQAQTQETRPPQARAASVRAASTPAPAAAPSKTVNFQEEYRYILTDLKRFGILAVAMFATLIVLALTLG